MDKLLTTPLSELLSERYLSYALSTIMSRSLPDVRDGLKPVHRRLIYAMRELKLNPDTGFKKCARIVGDVMGKYHPHGDSAIYDAMVRLAQSFSLRYPLVDGQGNFGTVDGDNAAAMRYTEARMTMTGVALLEGIDEECVDFRPTYDNEGEEPVILPAAFPNILANGASGIAVGMATNIPPHNILELCDAACALIDNPRLPNLALTRIVKGPDFPTGGILAKEDEEIEKAYITGKGSFRLRVRWYVEKEGGDKIIINEIPWQCQKLRMVEKISLMIRERKLPAFQAIYDESTEDIRIVLEPRRNEKDFDAMMESIFRTGEGETRIALNMNVLDKKNTPRVMGLGDVLRAWLEHRHDILVRRKRYRLKMLETRLDVLEGYLICYRFMDKVISIIREEDKPHQRLMKVLGMNERQARAVLEMRLRQLRHLEEKDIRLEHKALGEEKRGLEILLRDEKKRWQAIKDEILALKEKYHREDLGKRRTDIEVFRDIKLPARPTAQGEPMTVCCSAKGWIRGIRGHNEGELRYKDGDQSLFRFFAQSTDHIIAMCSNGRSYGFAADKLPVARGFGEPITLFADIPGNQRILTLFSYTPKRKWILVSDQAYGFIVEEEHLNTRTVAGKTVFTMRADERITYCQEALGDHVALLSNQRRLVVFPLSEISQIARGRGVVLQKYNAEQEKLDDFHLFTWDNSASWKGGQIKKEDFLTHRGRRGAYIPRRLLPKNKFLS